jgi:hypothetical protein
MLGSEMAERICNMGGPFLYGSYSLKKEPPIVGIEEDETLTITTTTGDFYVYITPYERVSPTTIVLGYKIITFGNYCYNYVNKTWSGQGVGGEETWGPPKTVDFVTPVLVTQEFYDRFMQIIDLDTTSYLDTIKKEELSILDGTITHYYSTVDSIGSYAFANCPSLVWVSIPNATTISG